MPENKRKIIYTPRQVPPLESLCSVMDWFKTTGTNEAEKPTCTITDTYSVRENFFRKRNN